MKYFAIIFLVFLVVITPSCGYLSAGAKEQEIAEAQKEADSYKRGMPLIADKKVVNYVSDIGKRLLAEVPAKSKKFNPKVEFFTFNAVGPSSFAAGRYVFLERAEIEKAESEGEVAGVLGHEVAHIILGHVIFNSNYGWCMEYFEMCANKHYESSREHKGEADAMAVRLMVKAGYDPEDLVKNFAREAEKMVRAGDKSGPSHPPLYERIKKIRAIAKTLRVSKKPIKNTKGLSEAKESLKKIRAKSIWFY